MFFLIILITILAIIKISFRTLINYCLFSTIFTNPRLCSCRSLYKHGSFRINGFLVWHRAFPKFSESYICLRTDTSIQD